MKMLQIMRRGFMFVLTIVMLIPAMSGVAATPGQEAIKAYSRWLSGSKVQVMPKGYYDGHEDTVYSPSPASQTEFAIAYINNDSIPELIVRTSNQQYCSVLTYKNGKIVRIWYNKYGLYNSVKGYFSKTGVFVDKRHSSFAQIADYQHYMVFGSTGVIERFSALESSVKGGQRYEYYSLQSKKWTYLKNRTEFRNRLMTFTRGRSLSPAKYYKNTAVNRKTILK